MRCDGERGRDEVEQAHAEDAAKQYKRRVAELHVGCAGDHVPDFAGAGVNAKRESVRRVAEPDAAAGGFDLAGEGAVVDEGLADALDAVDAAKRDMGDENGSSGCGGKARAWIGRAAEGIEHLEEEDEGGNQGALGEGGAAKADHLRDEVATFRFGLGYEAGDVVRRVLDVGIGQ